MIPLISILIPAYNAEKWIKYSIESSINQTWPKKEIIVVDDGSNDNTLSIARKYQSKELKVVSQDNKGASNARNTALSYAQGDYIQWLDADDFLDPTKISTQLSLSRLERDTDMLLTSAFGFFFYRIEKTKFIYNIMCRDMTPIDYFMFKFIHNSMIPTNAWLVNRKLTDLAGPWNEKLTLDDDGEYFCRVVTLSKAIKHIPEAKSYIRKGNLSSLSAKITDNAAESLMLSTGLCIGHLLKMEDSEKTRKASIKYLQYQLPYFYPDKKNIIKQAEGLAKVMGGVLVPEETWKFRLVRKIFGWKLAKFIKQTMWNTYILSQKHIDKFFYFLLQKSCYIK
jgi:glycosyltransferase involved in cell wall biosynthesis